MDKLSTPNAASSPVPSDSGEAEPKHDSFLEDVGLIPGGGGANYWLSERNVTKRSNSPTTGSPFSSMLSKEDSEEKNNVERMEIKRRSDKCYSGSISTSRREIGSGDRSYREDFKSVKIGEDKKVDNVRGKSRYSDPKASDNRTRIQNDNKKSLARRSAGSKDKEQSLLVISEGKRDRRRRSDSGDKNFMEISDSVALLSAIKEIVSTYTKEESIKITKMMNELHILSQASMIKNFIFQSDDIKRATGGDSSEYGAIIEENKILRENLETLKFRYENAEREIEERKEENDALRLRIQELSARTSS